jgi:preprotein translocase subunit SecA
MDKSGIEEGEVITHPLVTRAIENAQKKVELRNFQARKRLLEYDDVMNQQREVVYSLRLFALEGGEELKAEVLKMLEHAATRFAEEMGAEEPETWDRKAIATELMVRYLLTAREIEDPARVPDRAALISTVTAAVRSGFGARLAMWDEQGRRHGVPDLAGRLLAHVLLQVLDEKWKDHLYDLDQLRNAIQYRAWGQKDPLVEYKQEAFEMFVDLMRDIRATVMDRFFKTHVNLAPQRPAPPRLGTAAGSPPAAAPPRSASDTDLMLGARPMPPSPAVTAVKPSAGGDGEAAPRTASRTLPKVGRNDPCPCGSGKKYKKCHGAGG